MSINTSNKTTKTSQNTSSMQLTTAQKEKFLEYLEKKGLPAPTGSTKSLSNKDNSEIEVKSIDYIEMCMDDLILKMSKLDSYKNQTFEQKENIEINMKLEFSESIVNAIAGLFEEKDASFILESMGKTADSIEELMEMVAGLIATIPGMSDFTIKTIIIKYKDLCDEMGFLYNSNLIHSLITNIA
jgi:hypothetical protein